MYRFLLGRPAGVLAAVFGLALLPVLVACASIVGGSAPQPVQIYSNPGGIPFSVRTQAGRIVQRGTTPAIVALPRSAGYFQSAEYVVEFQSKDRERVLGVTSISPSVSLWYLLGNLAVGGLIGWLIVDPATGAMWTLPESVSFQAGDLSHRGGGTGYGIAALADVPEHLRNKLQPVEDALQKESN